MKRGDIYQANLQPRSGSEQQGRRPILVISHDGFNQNVRWRSIIVIPISTSSAQAKRGLTAVLLTARHRWSKSGKCCTLSSDYHARPGKINR